MSKSKRTQRRYRKANRNQTALDAFMSTARAAPTSVARKFPQSAEVDISSAVPKAASSKLLIYKPSPHQEIYIFVHLVEVMIAYAHNFGTPTFTR